MSFHKDRFAEMLYDYYTFNIKLEDDGQYAPELLEFALQCAFLRQGGVISQIDEIYAKACEDTDNTVRNYNRRTRA